MEALDTGSSAAGVSSVQAFLSPAASSLSPSSSSPSSSSTTAAPAVGATASTSSSSASAGGLLISSSDANPRSPSLNAALARDASSLFHSSRYQECIDVLHQILLSDHENPKVLHNIAVVEYFRDGCADPQKLLELLSKVKKKIEELCKKSVREQWDDVSALPSSSPPNANSPGLKGSITGTNPEIPAYLEDYDTSIPIFNSAVILSHVQQYAAALTVLEPLYHNIEVIDEPAALRICSLMLDTALASCQPRKACVFDTMSFCIGSIAYLARCGWGQGTAGLGGYLKLRASALEAVHTRLGAVGGRGLPAPEGRCAVPPLQKLMILL